MRYVQNVAFVTVLLLGSTAFYGCNNSGLPKTEKVSGQVTYKGDPVENATVIFSRGSKNIAQGEIALGKTDADGKFVLTTHLSGQADVEGAIVGDYEVTVSKKIPPPGMTQAEYDKKMDAINKASEQGSVQPPGMELPPLVEMLPRKYSAAAATELKAEVKPNDANEFVFDLK